MLYGVTRDNRNRKTTLNPSGCTALSISLNLGYFLRMNTTAFLSKKRAFKKATHDPRKQAMVRTMVAKQMPGQKPMVWE